MPTLPAYLLFWLVLMVLAIGNGIAREYLYGSALSELHAHQLSTVTGMLITGAAVWGFARLWMPPRSAREAVLIGLAWLLFTIAFEFLFGRYVAGHSWARLFQDYNIFAGRLWLVFLLWLTMLPYTVFSLHR